MLWTIFVYGAVYFGLFIGIFFLFTFFENKESLKERKATRIPKVSIMVPAYNEEDTLSGTLYSLLSLDYPKEKFEIIVIDDGSKDRTLEIAKRFEKRGVKVLTKKNSGKGSSLNYGLKFCTGELAGCLDADSFVKSDALIKMVGYFEDSRVMAVTPSIKIWKDKNILQKIQKIEYLMGVFLRKAFSYLDSIHVTPGPFTIYRKEFFDKYGGYDENNLTEDIEIALRIQRYGYRIENVMDANVYTIGPSKFKPLLRQRNRWYLGFLNNVMNYKDLFGVKHGNLGIFILPSAFISISMAIILFFYSVANMLINLFNNVANMSSINFDLAPFLKWSMLGSLSISLNPLKALAIISIIMGVAVIWLTKKYSKEESEVFLSYPIYILLYWILFSFWWVIAISLKIFNKKIGW